MNTKTLAHVTNLCMNTTMVLGSIKENHMAKEQVIKVSILFSWMKLNLFLD